MTPTPPDRLEQLLDRVRGTNPFVVNRVDATPAARVDVSAIHEAAFHKLLTLTQQAHAQNHGLGVVLWGPAGVGKSHLLARFGRWTAQQERVAFITLHNLQADPERLPRDVLNCTISSLVQGRAGSFHGTGLYRLIRAAVEAAVQQAQLKRRTPFLITAAYNQLLDRLLAENPMVLDRAVFRVLLHFYLSANVAHHFKKEDGLAELAVQWLSGKALERDEAHRLELRPEGGADGVGLADDQQIKQVLVALVQLARLKGEPFVLCFDQVDNLDDDKIGALSRFLHALLDSTGNLLVVTSGVQQTLNEFRKQGTITTSSWDRLGKVEITLSHINRGQAQELVAARLTQFLGPYRDLPEIQRLQSGDVLFPLGSPWFESRLERRANDYRPREVINWANERWQEQQQLLATQSGPTWLVQWTGGGVAAVVQPEALDPDFLVEAIDRKVDQILTEQQAHRGQSPHTLPPSGDNLCGLVHSLLQQCLLQEGKYAITRVERVPPPKPGQRPAYDLLLRHAAGPERRESSTGLLFLSTSSPTSAAGSLRRLLQEHPPRDRWLLVTDARLPLPLGTSKHSQGKRYLEELRQRGPAGFLHLELTFEQYATLDALAAVIWQARSGDLEVELPGGGSRTISEYEVIASHERRGRYRTCPLLDVLLADPAAHSTSARAESSVLSEQI